MLQSLRKRAAADSLAGQLRPDERIVVATSGLHPRALFDVSFFAVMLLGCLGGLVLGSLFGGGITLFIVLFAVLCAWWFSLARYASAEQPAGLEPRIVLTDRRIIHARRGVGGRVTAIHEAELSQVLSFTVRGRWRFMPRTELTLDGGATLRYRVLHAREIERQLAGSSG